MLVLPREYLSSGVPFYRGKEISLLSNGSGFESDIYISEERFKELKAKYGVPKNDDILLTSGGTIGNTYLVEESDKFYFKDGNLSWFNHYKSEIGGKYLKTWFDSKEAELAIENIKIGSTQQAITISSINTINMIFSSENVIKNFNIFLEDIFRKVRSNTKQIHSLTKLRETLDISVRPCQRFRSNGSTLKDATK